MNANTNTTAVNNDVFERDLPQDAETAAFPVALSLEMLNLVAGGDDVICW